MSIFDAVSVLVVLGLCLVVLKIVIWLAQDELERVIGVFFKEFRLMAKIKWSPQSLNAFGTLAISIILFLLLNASDLKAVVADSEEYEGLRLYLIAIVVSALIVLIGALFSVWLTGARD